MNGDAHTIIMRGAFAALPAAIRQSLEPVRPLIEIVGNYPDLFDDPTRSDEARDRDDPEWRRFCRFPPAIGGTTQHYWPAPIFDQERCRPMIAYLLGQAVAARRAGELDAFMKFVGCLSHYMGDVCQPIHTVDEHLIAELLPPPPGMSEFHYHRDLEAVTGACGPLAAPILLGLDVDEASWRIAQANLRAIAACRPYVVPTLQALFAADEGEAIRLAGPPVTLAAQMTADILYTIVRLATEPKERLAPEGIHLREVDLRMWRPDDEKQSSAYGGAILDGSRATPPAGAPIIPAALRFDDGNVEPVGGLGVMPTVGSTPHACWMTFGLPGGVFDRFEAMVGLHAGLTTTGGAQFIVELDGSEVYRSGPRTSQDTAQAVHVQLGQAMRLTLKVEDIHGGTTYFDNHAIWGAPRLLKAS